ncbi:MAG: hypothetical protein AAB665_01045 [Patescibacteria group bacterium]
METSRNQMEDAMRELSAREKANVLRVAKDHVPNKTVPSRLSTVRGAVATALAESGFWFAGLGSNRERTTSIEIARALELKGGLQALAEWDKNSDRKTVLAGLDTTIMNLQ